MGELTNLKGLGKRAEIRLNKIGIYTQKELQKMGALAAYVKLGEPNLCFLYALEGALKNRNWIDIARFEKTRLIIELDNYKSE
jgi:DNA transformation protein